MAKETYSFFVEDFPNAMAYVIIGKSETGNRITVASFYYNYGIDKLFIRETAEVFTNQLNTQPLTLES